ncbi:hypothetical protein WJX84_000686 [Apatococcus fuscideae]|uniref:DUF2256 domain-containing protein n=1 Tax=Apatococcus fuscideae TaxID=2026836 RepID=A0AAW1T2R8_9CHLO
MQTDFEGGPSRKVKKGSKKGKAVAKADLPTKTCLVCGRPFNWRKKWESCWDEVKYCSDRCRREKNAPQTPES